MSHNLLCSINPTEYSGLSDDDVLTTILAPLVDRAREQLSSVAQDLEMADVIQQVILIA